MMVTWTSYTGIMVAIHVTQSTQQQTITCHQTCSIQVLDRILRIYGVAVQWRQARDNMTNRRNASIVLSIAACVSQEHVNGSLGPGRGAGISKAPAWAVRERMARTKLMPPKSSPVVAGDVEAGRSPSAITTGSWKPYKILHYFTMCFVSILVLLTDLLLASHEGQTNDSAYDTPISASRVPLHA